MYVWLKAQVLLCAFLSFLPWWVCLYFWGLSERPGVYVLLGSNKIGWLLFIFLAVYRLIAATAYGIDKGHISIFSSIFKGSGWMSCRQYIAGSATKHELAVNWSLVISEINCIERSEKL